MFSPFFVEVQSISTLGATLSCRSRWLIKVGSVSCILGHLLSTLVQHVSYNFHNLEQHIVSFYRFFALRILGKFYGLDFVNSISISNFLEFLYLTKNIAFNFRCYFFLFLIFIFCFDSKKQLELLHI